MRDIAKRADISLGNVYNYFETKEAIFESIINRYLVVVDQQVKDILEELDEPLDPADMRRLGEMIGEMVDQYQDFWLLMYIDTFQCATPVSIEFPALLRSSGQDSSPSIPMRRPWSDFRCFLFILKAYDFIQGGFSIERSFTRLFRPGF